MAYGHTHRAMRYGAALRLPHTRMNLFFARITAFILPLFILSACKDNSKPFHALSDDEKIAFDLDTEGLSPQQIDAQKQARRAILDRVNDTRSATEAITTAMNHAKAILEPGDYERLRQSQDTWQRSLKGHDINALVQQGLEPAAAFAKATHARADWIATRTSWAILISTDNSIHPLNGLYRAGDRMIEIYAMPNHTINFVLRSHEGFVWTASGSSLDPHRAHVASEHDPRASLEVTLDDNGNNLTLLPNESFASSPLSPMRALVTGIFVHLQPGDLDVFAP